MRKRLLTPDYMFERYSDVTPGFLREINVTALLIDIDNTLAPYEQPKPDAAHFTWFEELKEAKISVALISNNSSERVNLFNKELMLPAYPDCGKPKKKFLLVAMRDISANPKTAAVLGDQLLTDCYAAKRLGLRAIIVPPIKDKRTLFFRFKRMLERPVIKKFKKEHENTKSEGIKK